MSRAANGTYTAPTNSWNSAVEGTTIDESDWNETLADVVDALTDSVSRTGKGTVSAHIDFDENGSPGTPSSNVGRLYASDVGGATSLMFKDAAGNTYNLLLSSPGLAFSFDTSTNTASDPGNGDIRFNSSTYTAVTEIAVDDLDGIGNNVETFLQALQENTYIFFHKRSGAGIAVYQLVSASNESGFTKLTVTYVDHDGSFAAGDPISLSFGPAGTEGPMGDGDVDGPASSTDNAVPRFDGTGGKTLQNSVVIISDTGNISLAPSLTGSASSGGTLTLSATSAGSGTTDTITLNASVYQLQSRGGAASYLTIDASGHLYVAGSSSFGTKDVLLGRTQGSAWMTTTNVVSTQGESASSVILNDNIYTSVEAAGTVDNTAVRGVGRAFGATESYTPNSGVTYVRGGEFHALMSDDAGTTGNVAWGVEIGVHNQRASLSRADGAVGVRIHSGNDGWFPSGVLRADAAIYVDGEAGFDYLYAFYDTDNTTLLAHVNYLGEAYFAGQVTSGRITATSTNAAAFAVGRQGSTNPVLQVDASASTVVTGLKVTGAAAAAGAALAVISSGTNEALTIDAKGSGTITLNGTGTGNITTPRPLRTTDTTGSSSTSTGSLVASGGLGVGENIRAAGLISAAAASGYYLGTTVFAIQAGNYRAFYNGDGAGFMTIGNSVDESFYLDSNTIAFRTRGSLTSMGSITSSGWSSPGAIKSTSATSGIGYATGAGGTVTQATSKSTGVTLNAVCGEITMNNASLGVGITVGFVLTNSAIAATDTVLVNIKSGATADSYLLNVTAVSAGSCRIELRNPTGGALAEAVVLSFVVIKGVTS